MIKQFLKVYKAYIQFNTEQPESTKSSERQKITTFLKELVKKAKRGIKFRSSFIGLQVLIHYYPTTSQILRSMVLK